MSIETVLRFVGGVLAGIGAWHLSLSLLPPQLYAEPASVFFALFAIVAASFGIAFLVTPYLTTRPFYWILDSVVHASPADLLAGSIGLASGLALGALLAIPLANLPWVFGWVLPIAISLVLGYVGSTTLMTNRSEMFAALGLPSDWQRGKPQVSAENQRVVVDTSAIIDGRVADIVKAGFLSRSLVVPQSVLGELQRIADSPDPLRRARGRRGLDILTRLQKDPSVTLDVIDTDIDGSVEVDAQLVILARSMSCPILTNDYNLNRVAVLQGVRVLNVNELANAVRPVVLPGEEMTIKLIQEGTEFGQGVGYLEDGTMVVVEGGRHLLNSTTDVVVSRVLQTVAGRMIFAQPKNAH